jgi:tetratricopeptide (TPR) repeat protein
LLARFAAASSRPAAKRGTTNEEAYRLYLQGKDWTVKGSLEHAQKGIANFEQAIRLDPNFARAYSAMAYAYIRSGHLGGGMPRDEYEKARVAVTKALELDDNLAEGYRVLGELKHVYEWDSAGAENAWRRAFELEPNSESRYAGYLAESGRFDESIAAIDRMIEADPNSLQLRRERGRILYLAGRYDEAIVQLKRVLELDESLTIARAFLEQSYVMKGEYAEAYESFIESQKQAHPEHVDLYRKAYETAGWRGVAEKHLELEKLKENQPSGNYYRIARYCALLGEKEMAFEYLNKAVEKRHGQLRMLRVEPYFNSLRDDPRFDELLKRVGWP